MNFKTLLGALSLCIIIGGWAVTASVTQDNKTEIKETQKDVEDLKEVVIRQTAQTATQQLYNSDVAKILEKLAQR